MVISKDIIGTIDIDTQSGRVWLNAPNCILRIQDLQFNGIKEKFSMIDISGNKASMIEGDLVLDDKRLVRFILDLFSSLSFHFINGRIKDKDKFIDLMYEEVSKMIEKHTLVGGI